MPTDHDDYRQLIERSPDAILISRDDRVAYSNNAAIRLLGAPAPGSLRGRAVWDMFRTDSGVRERFETLAAEPVRFDDQIVRLDGTICDVEVSIAVLDDHTRATQIVLRDLTERKLAEAALRQSEERLTLAFAGAREGVWDWNLETNAVIYSTRWKQMLGYTDDEIEPHVSAWERLVHPDDRKRADRANESVARGAPTYEAEFRLRHKEGHYVHVLSRGFPIRRAPGGPVARIVGTHLDITDRIRANAALRESEERLRLAFAGAQEGVWDWNLETGAVVYSTRWKEMLGYTEDEIEPHVRAWESLLHPDDKPLADRLHDSVTRGASTYEGEFRLRHKDGHYVLVLSRGYPVRREAEGPVVRIVGTHFDLTARKAAEEMIERERAERARTELLGRLVFAQEDERRRIAREMHDQFGELLTAIARRIEVLKLACSGSAEQLAHVTSLAGLIQQLDRDVDHLVWELRPTALDDLGLRAALANYIQDWSQRVSIPAELHTAGLLDDRLTPDVETTLYRIAQEALTNVAKHSRATSVGIILERRTGQVLLAIEDDGIGFDPAAAENAKRGLGLLGMQERAALVGATLEIESGAGKGTTVLLRLSTPESTAVVASSHPAQVADHA